MLATIIKGDHEKILDKISNVSEKDQDFILSIRYLVETNNVELLRLIFDNKSVVSLGDLKVVSLAAESSLEIFKMFKPLFDKEFHFETHPLINACATGNTQVVKYIVNRIRNGDIESNDPHKLKELAIKIASRKGYVSVLLQLCKTREHVHHAISGLISNGNHKEVPRMLVHPEVDFSTNDFELLKLCSVFTVELLQISRHKSVYENYNKLPADYYRNAVDASKQQFQNGHGLMQHKHKMNVKRTSAKINTSAKSGVHEYSIFHPLHEISNRYHKSARTANDIKDMVTSVHYYHKPEHVRQMYSMKLDKFVL